MAAGGVGEAVGPFAQQGFDQRFGFAVGLGSAWPGVAAGDAQLDAGVAPGKAAIAVAVVGEHSLDRDAVIGIPAGRAGQEAGTVLGALAGQDFGVGEP